MKSIKIIVLFLLLFAGTTVMAQQVGVDNQSNLTNGTLDFQFSGGCGPVNLPFWAGSLQSIGSPCPASTLVQVDVVFDDPTCPAGTPPFGVTLTPTSPSFSYIDCSGVTVTITLILVGGSDWVVQFV